jgi:3-phenylpropionate/trans-cinnamate dioxygenase ferredoxin reductase component
MQERVVIIGGGQAGARAAAWLRKEGWQGAISLIGDEPELPYERPPLSKSVLSEGADPLRALVLPEQFYAEAEIDLQVGMTATAIDPADRKVKFGGSALAFDHLVLATGGRARRLHCPGADLDGVLTLRSAADARNLASRLTAAASVVVIGGGFIGLEVAASARRLGCDCTVLQCSSQLLGRLLDPATAGIVAAAHRSHGIDVRLGVEVASIEGENRVQAVLLTDGSRIEADIVVVGIGAVANDELARASAVPCSGGVLTDFAGRTRASRVYAVGDVARQDMQWGANGVRMESWENAEIQPKNAARSILDRSVAAPGAPWFWTDQFDLNLQILGWPRAGKLFIERGRPEQHAGCIFAFANNRIVGAVLFNAGRERRIVRQLMECDLEIDARHLADESRPLKSLLAAVTA